MLRIFIQILTIWLPWAIRRLALNSLSGFSIHPTAKIGYSIVLADQVILAANARVGHFNYIGRLDLLRLDEEALIGNLNWIPGLSQRLNSPFFRKKANRRSDLILGRCSMIANQHYIDCSDRVEFQPFSALAGVRTQLMTHGVEPISSRQVCGPITIGEFSMIGSGSLLLRGVHVPSCCIVGAGSVVSHLKPESFCLFSGNPAVLVRKLPETAKLFARTDKTVY